MEELNQGLPANPAFAADAPDEIIRIGASEVSTSTGELMRDGQVVLLGRRTLNLLAVLLEARGGLVSTEQIHEKVWAGRVVEQNTLQWQISSLRKALGKDRSHLRTYSGRGYRLDATRQPVSSGSPSDNASVYHAAANPVFNNLPPSSSILIGREEALAALRPLMLQERVVTLTGPGGIGKTRLSLAVAEQSLQDFPGGVFFVDLSSVAKGDDVVSAIIAYIGAERSVNVTLQHRIQGLGDRPALVLLDNCEQVIEAAASCAEIIVRSNAAVTVLATSREPLRAEGEFVFQIPSLRLPPSDFQSVTTLLDCGATQLFIGRSATGRARFMGSSKVGEQIIKICRHLDGNPLAIELAAARADSIGIEEVALRLEDVLSILVDGRRTALPRHQTLRATLAWSYALLNERERTLFRRLAVFAGGFTLGSAHAIASKSEFSESEVLDLVSSLVAKSLVAIDTDGAARRYRLLETTRAYALELLEESGEYAWLAGAHASYYTERIDATAFKSSGTIHEFALITFLPEWDNVRAALNWAFSGSGDAALGVALAARATPLLYEMMQLDECWTVASRALDVFDGAGLRDKRMELPIRTCLASSAMYLRGPTAATVEAWEGALQLSKEAPEHRFETRALWGLWTAHIFGGRPGLALRYAQEYEAASELQRNEHTRMLAHRCIGVSHHYLGNHGDANRHLNESIAYYVHGYLHLPLSNLIDHATLGRATLARTLWFLGHVERATDLMEMVVADAVAEDNPLSICYVTTECALPVSLLVNDRAATRRYRLILQAAAERHGSLFWVHLDRCYAALLSSDGVLDAQNLSMLRQGIDELHSMSFDTYSIDLRNRLAHALYDAGRIDEALAMTNQTLRQVGTTSERLWEADLLRARARFASHGKTPAALVEAERDLVTSIDIARGQGALSLELRSAKDLARLLASQGRRDEARTLISGVYEQFTEGHQTLELRDARELIATLA